jgi:leucyl-tRNA synthetase
MRLYEMFMGPLEAVKPWNTAGVEGVFRFLKRSWRLISQTPVSESAALGRDLERLLHVTIRKVTHDTETLNFNTAISQMMIFINEFGKLPELPRAAAEAFVKLLAPYAPHLGEELWARLGHGATLAYEPWPEYDDALTRVDEVEILLQVLGKPKARIRVPADADEAALRNAALENPQVREAIAGKDVRKVICVKGKLVNIVVG